MVKCPNINSPQWRELVEKTDLQTAYRVFMQNEDSVPYLGTRDNNYLLDQVVTEFNIKKPLKGKDGRLLKLENRLFNRQVAEELVSDIRSSYIGDYTIDIVSIDENNNSIKIEGYPIPADKDINEVLYTVLDEDLNVSTKYEQRPFIEVKSGVAELFESNPELANAVYSTMRLNTINESEITWTDEQGNPCAKMGGRSSKFAKGSQWEIVKDLKGYPSHAQGGVDVKIGKDGFSFTRDNGVIRAKYGLVLPKIK